MGIILAVTTTDRWFKQSYSNYIRFYYKRSKLVLEMIVEYTVK